MELVVLFIIAALLFFGPRKGGGMPSPLAVALAALFLLRFPVAMSLKSLLADACWNARLEILEGAGHINTASGHGPFPSANE